MKKFTSFCLLILTILLAAAATADSKGHFKPGKIIEITENNDDEATISIDGEQIRVKQRKLNHVRAKDQPKLPGATNIDPLDCVFTASDDEGEIIYQSTKKCKGGKNTKDTILSKNGENFDIDNEQENGRGKKKGTLKASKKEPSPELREIRMDDNEEEFQKWRKSHGKKNPKLLRSKRQIPPGNKTIDIAVVYDHDVYADAVAAGAAEGISGMQKLQLFHTSVWQKADLLMFNLKQTKYNFRYVAVYTSLANAPSAIVNFQDGAEIVQYMDALNSFYANYDFSQDYWAFFTGFNLKYDGNSNVVGVAYRPSMCLNRYGFVSEVYFNQRTDQWHASVVAHETGHTLRIQHDGDPPHESCGSGSIMWPYVTITNTWSTCSESDYGDHLQFLIDRNQYCLA